MLRFVGPVVVQNQLLFASDWMQTTGKTLDEIVLRAGPLDGGFPAQVVGVGPMVRRWTPERETRAYA